MTYIERREWCSSSVSTTDYFSTTQKRTKPCPISSSSVATSSSISFTDRNLISNDSAVSSWRSYGERTNTLSLAAKSTCQYSNEYYTRRRIEELHERMDDIQVTNFLNFINHHLSSKNGGKTIEISDLSNGCILIQLIEILSLTKLKHEHGSTRFHALNNVRYVLDYLRLRQQHVDISPYEIVSGNRKQTLALIWIIMKTFGFPSFRITNRNCLLEKTLLGFGQDRSIIIHWLNNILNHSLNTQEIYIEDFYINTWINGYYLSVIIKYLIPLSLKYLTVKCFDYLRELNDLPIHDKRRFNLCLTISTYCFDTQTIIDYVDKTEKSLFRYFTELQQNVFAIIKNNHIGKLMQNNSYAKQVLDVAIQTRIEHSKQSVVNNDLYIRSIDDEQLELSRNEHSRQREEFTDQTTSSSNVIDESSILRISEKSDICHSEQQDILSVVWTEEKCLKSDFNLINAHDDIQNEEHMKTINDEVESLNVIVKKGEEHSLSDKQNEQLIISNETMEPSTVRSEDIDLEQSEKVNEEKQDTIDTDVNEDLESLISDTVEWKDCFSSIEDDEHTTQDHKKLEKTTILEKDTEKFTSPSSQTVVTKQLLTTVSIEEIKESTIEINQSQQEHSMNKDQYDNQVKTNYERSEQIDTNESKTSSIALIENEQQTNEFQKQEQIISSIDQSGQHESTLVTHEPSLLIIEEEQQNSTLKEQNEQSSIKNKSIEQASLITIGDMSPMNNHEQSIIKVNDRTNQRRITPMISFKKVDQFITNKSLESVVSNNNGVISRVECNHANTKNDKLEQSIPVQTTKSISANEENIENTNNISNHENFISSNGNLQQSIANTEDIKPYKPFIENDSSISIDTEASQSVSTETSHLINTEMIDALPLNRKLEPIVAKHANNDHIVVEKKLEQHTSQPLIQDEKLNETTAMTSTSNYLSSVTHKKLEKPTVIELPQPIPLNQHIEKSINKRQNFTAVVKNLTLIPSSFQEQQYNVISSEQSSIESKINWYQSGQPTFASKVKAVKDAPFADVASRQQASIASKDATKIVNSLKNQGNTVEIQENIISSIVTIEKSKQNIQANVYAEQDISTSIIRKNEQSDISTRQHEANTTILQEEHATSMASTNGSQISVQKPIKKKKRSRARKNKAKKSHIENENSSKLVGSHETGEEEEENTKLLSSSTDEPSVSTTQEQSTTNVESDGDTTSSIVPEKLSNEDTPIKCEIHPNSATVRSRKIKKKPSSAKNSSSPATLKTTMPIETTTKVNRTVFLRITETIKERKFLGFACVFILVFACAVLIVYFTRQ